jgi:hypothetical protein
LTTITTTTITTTAITTTAITTTAAALTELVIVAEVLHASWTLHALLAILSLQRDGFASLTAF